MLRKLALVLGIALVAAIGWGVYVWKQATALPDWYTEADPGQWSDSDGDDVDPQDPAAWEVIPDEEVSDDEPPPPPPKGVSRPGPRKKRKTRELRNFHRRTKRGRKSPVVKASRATFDGERLEAGVIVDLSRVPREKLTARDRDLLDNARAAFPPLRRRDVYVGIVDRPVRDGDTLRLGPTPRVKIGNLRTSLPRAAKKLGMSTAQLRAEIDRELLKLGPPPPG